MGLPQEVLDLLLTPIYIERFMGKDTFGNPVYAPSEEVMAVVSVVTRRRGAPHPRMGVIGTPTEITSQVIVDYGDFGPLDRVTLPGNRRVNVISVDTRSDETGEPFFQQFIVEENRK